jgi:hypothetical protein
MLLCMCDSNKENSSVTGSLSAVTARFYVAMACKSLIIGYKPKDNFDILFPYKAIVENKLDGSHFELLIDFYLNNKEEYYEIVCRNYDWVT